MDYGNFTWTGKSGNKYYMDAFSLDTEVNPDVSGNYIFGELYTQNNIRKIRAIYIGEGKLKDRIDFRINEGRVQQKGCNCFCAMVNEDEESRKAIEDDLLAANPDSYAPKGCNIRIGG